MNQVGGGSPGQVLLVSADFDPPVDTQSGVAVTLPGYSFASSFSAFSDGGSTEPGNLPGLLLGSPTDITFTLPGAGGPDGTAGDGSLQFLLGGTVTLGFGSRTAPMGALNDLVFFTNTASGGMALIEVLSPGDVVLESITAILPDGAAGTGTGGLVLNVTDGFLYSSVRFTKVAGGTDAVEVDAVAALIPEPATALLLGAGLAVLVASRRR